MASTVPSSAALELAASRVGEVKRNQLPDPDGLRPRERPSMGMAVSIPFTMVDPSLWVR